MGDQALRDAGSRKSKITWIESSGNLDGRITVSLHSHTDAD